MSSIFGHALIGAAIGDNAKAESKSERLFLSFFFMGLVVCPDLDYLLTWCFGINIAPRYTHSIGASLAIACIGLGLKKYVFVRRLRNANPLLICAASMAHVLMDYCVGVHKNPIFWPLTESVYAFEYGFLPSAGKLDFLNFYFWRNLLIEMGILVPVAAFISARGRNALKKRVYIAILATGVLMACGYISVGLSR
ncbi:metal-dependent hydrolase [Hahella sp. CR1]|uniref:metal-dependent hydrolase n=1 Tax=Hahella sp. CR1 TaxID=2992807 RepID=UPI0024433DCE|nr:metal-dependent hydrolase [Hahella sp. CR1]MDG9671654.1 metal-dependent hydrolase [Hahella sp. CR1]